MSTWEQQEAKDYCKSERVSNLRNNNYIENDSNRHKNRNVSLDEYIRKTKLYLRNIIPDLENYDTWKIQLANCN